MATRKNKVKKMKSKKKLKDNPSVYRYSVNMNEIENIDFHAMMEKAGVENKSKFILNCIFGKEMKVVKIDKAKMDFYMRLTNFYTQYQKVGVNYNQVVKALKTNFGEKKALALLYKLEKYTIDFIVISKQIIEFTNEFEQKYGNEGK